MIDGQRSGTVNGDKTQIFLTEGTHEVTIYFNGETLFERKIFVQDDSQRVIDLSE